MIRRAGRLVLLGLGLVALFSLLMVVTYSIPSAPVKSHMASSLAQLQLERYPHKPFVGLTALATDNFTDALMLNEALGTAGGNPVRSAFGNYLRITSTWDQIRPIEDLELAIRDGGNPAPYARYWHGYQVVLRPLLVILDYRAIRLLNAIVFFVLMAFAGTVMLYRLGAKAAIAFLVALFSAGVIIVPMSIQYSGVFYIALTGVVIVALRMDREGRVPLDLEILLVLGALTSFVDLLTAPAVTLGLPLAVALIGRMRSETESAWRRQWGYAAKLAIAWLAGYAGIWVAKWLLSSLVLGYSVLGEAAQFGAYRLGGGEAAGALSQVKTIGLNLAMLFPVVGWHQNIAEQWGVIAAMCLVPAIPTIWVLVALAAHRRTDGRLPRLLGLLPAALLPFAWYVVLNNHSLEHFWMTYRALAITLFVAVFGVLYSFDPAYLSRLKSRVLTYLRGEVLSDDHAAE